MRWLTLRVEGRKRETPLRILVAVLLLLLPVQLKVSALLEVWA